MPTKNTRTKGTVGPNIVRAWFDTVLNPLLRSLTTEAEHLERKDWTWRFVPGGLERIRPVRGHVDIGARDNLEQFLELHSAIEVFVKAHDKKVDILSNNCDELQRRLEESAELQRLFRRVASTEVLAEIGVDLQQVFGAYPPKDRIALIAQYIVNNTGELPDHYTTARFWNKYKDEFLGILRHRSLLMHASSTERAAESLLKNVELLLRMLKETRLKLSLEHDVPYVSTSTSNREGIF